MMTFDEDPVVVPHSGDLIPHLPLSRVHMFQVVPQDVHREMISNRPALTLKDKMNTELTSALIFSLDHIAHGFKSIRQVLTKFRPY